MSLFQQYAAEELVKFVSPIHLGPNIFTFIVIDGSQEVTVSLNKKGWMCDYVEPKEAYLSRLQRHYESRHKPTRWSCSFNKDKICKHILSVHIFMERIGLNLCQD